MPEKTNRAAASATSATSTAGASTHNTQPAKTAVDALAEKFYAEWLKLNPTEATMLGLPGVESEYPDFSPAGAQEFDELHRATLSELNKTPIENDADRITAAALRERLGLAREIHATGRTELNNIASAPQGIRGIFDLMPTDTAEHWGHISQRLANVPQAMAGYRESLAASAQAGNIPAVRQIDTVMEQARAQASADGFFAQLAERDNPLSVADQEKLVAHAEGAAHAYAELVDDLAALREKAPTEDAVGSELYQLYSQQYVGTTLDLEETYHWGAQQLADIIRAQEDIARNLGASSVAEARQLLDNDPARQLHGTDALQEWMQNLADRALVEMTEYFDIPEPMNRIEAMIAPTQEGGIYYTGPSEDFSRPGRMWWSVPAGETQFSTWKETTTVYHEGVPGHHLQIATTMLAPLNDWRRNGLWVSGHGEGWALYSEKLMEEFGFLNDDGDRLGMLDAQRMRAARVVFDIGLHCGFDAPTEWGGKTWDAETGYQFLRENLNDSEGQLTFEWLRYMGWPGQAPSYMVGQRIWQNIRAAHEARAAAAGEEFDLKEFHTRALRLGSMGLDTLEMAMAL